MIDSKTAELAVFAERFNVLPCDAFVLPALFENAARAANMSARQLISDATYSNMALGEYLASVAKKAAQQVGCIGA